jgi:putative transposase
MFLQARAALKPGAAIVADQLCSYLAEKADIREMVKVKHLFLKAAARVNSCAEDRRQPTR